MFNYLEQKKTMLQLNEEVRIDNITIKSLKNKRQDLFDQIVELYEGKKTKVLCYEISFNYNTCKLKQPINCLFISDPYSFSETVKKVKETNKHTTDILTDLDIKADEVEEINQQLKDSNKKMRNQDKVLKNTAKKSNSLSTIFCRSTVF